MTTRAATPEAKIAALTSAICTRCISVRSSRINIRWNAVNLDRMLASDAATASLNSRITSNCCGSSITRLPIIIMNTVEPSISEPMLKQVGNGTRYLVCLRLNSKKPTGAYTGVREIAAIFLAARFDQFTETPRDLCAGVSYTAFPELENLQR